MAEEVAAGRVEEEGERSDSTASVHPHHTSHPNRPFLEVFCKSSGRVVRFAPGTKAGFAVYLINNSSGDGVPPSLFVEAVKEGEEPVNFGPSAELVHYGEGWKLQTVVEFGGDEARNSKRKINRFMATEISPHHSSKESGEFLIRTGATFSFLYLGKILAVFVFMFLFAAIITLLLESLPNLLSSVTSSSL